MKQTQLKKDIWNSEKRTLLDEKIISKNKKNKAIQGRAMP